MTFKEVRNKSGLSQSQLAKKSGISLSLIKKLEIGARKVESIKLKSLRQLSLAMNIEEKELLEMFLEEVDL